MHTCIYIFIGIRIWKKKHFFSANCHLNNEHKSEIVWTILYEISITRRIYRQYNGNLLLYSFPEKFSAWTWRQHHLLLLRNSFAHTLIGTHGNVSHIGAAFVVWASLELIDVIACVKLEKIEDKTVTVCIIICHRSISWFTRVLRAHLTMSQQVNMMSDNSRFQGEGQIPFKAVQLILRPQNKKMSISHFFAT